ncbi:MAG: DnaJ domain-containing protein [Opitutaceae bacterium]|nr:DnaJ domain-containing protein [Cytophagales bacterium]
MRVSHLAGPEELKRSYRRMVSRYHPDINPSKDAHQVLVELNEAYEILSDPNTKWIYDQHFLKKEEFYSQPTFETEPLTDKRKYRRGTKETLDQKQQKHEFAKRRNTSFNWKMKILSVVSLLFAGLIFSDHYLPTTESYQTVYASFKPDEVPANSHGSVAIFLNEGRKLELYPYKINNEITAIRNGEALFTSTPIFNIIKTIQVGKLVLIPFDSLYDLMLIYGIVCLSSMFVLSYRLEDSLVLPTILTFFDNMLVITFFTLLLTEN